MTLNVKTNRTTYYFDGPHQNTTPLKQQSGVYVITTIDQAGMHQVIDAGESGAVFERIANHDRSQQWPKHQQDRLFVSALYCDEPTRMLVESDIRLFFNPPCGIR